MPQVIAPPISGIDLGFAGSTGGRVRLLVGTGDPNTAATDNGNSDLASSAIGSLFLRNDAPDSTHGLYVKTALGVPGSVGTWTAK
jgi:hypothetical protein